MQKKMIAYRIKERRKELNLTQKELSEKIGISRATLSDYESGSKVPSLENFIKLSRELKCTPNDLLKDYFDIDTNMSLYYFRKVMYLISSLPDDKLIDLLKNSDVEL